MTPARIWVVEVKGPELPPGWHPTAGAYLNRKDARDGMEYLWAPQFERTRIVSYIRVEPKKRKRGK